MLSRSDDRAVIANCWDASDRGRRQRVHVTQGQDAIEQRSLNRSADAQFDIRKAADTRRHQRVNERHGCRAADLHVQCRAGAQPHLARSLNP